MSVGSLASGRRGELQLTELTYRWGDLGWAPRRREKRPGHLTRGSGKGPPRGGPPVTSFSQNEADLKQGTAGHFLCASPGPGLTPSSLLGPTEAWKPSPDVIGPSS